MTRTSNGEERMRLIGICGKMGAGKDEVAKILGQFGYVRHAYADSLRKEVVKAITTKQQAPECLSPLALEAFTNAFACEVHAKPTTPRMRALLQEWATEYRRAQCPGYWLDKMRVKLIGLDRACISDVRFADEADLVREFGGKVWRVKRPRCQESAHVSERLQFAEDYIIHNTGTLDDLASEVKRALTIQGLI